MFLLSTSPKAACPCDEMFYLCLKKERSLEADGLGYFYFNLVSGGNGCSETQDSAQLKNGLTTSSRSIFFVPGEHRLCGSPGARVPTGSQGECPGVLSLDSDCHPPTVFLFQRASS